MNTYTKEQKQQWDAVTGPGLYNVDGPAAFEYVCSRLTELILYGDDPSTVLLIGHTDDLEPFLKRMSDKGVIDYPIWEPEFFTFQEKEVVRGYGRDDEGVVGPRIESYTRCVNSEDDVEAFCNFIRNAKVKQYHRVGAVVVFNPDDQTKHLDKLLKIPVLMNGTTRYIELPVYVVSNTDGWSEFSKVSKNSKPGLTRTIELFRADEIEVKTVDLLVPGFIVRNAPNAFSGEMDSRKSTASIDIAAKGSVFGSRWLTGEENDGKPFLTLFAGAEDDYSTTVVPRFLAAGGNPDCFYCLKLDVKNEKQTADGLQVWETPLSLDEHIELLREQIRHLNATREWRCGLLICDPIISFFGDKNYNSPQDARDIMRQQKELCEQEQITIINICHFNKTQGLTAKQKTAGSKALIEAHRMAWAFDLMEDDPKITLIAPIKKNLLAEAKSYKITTVDNDGVGVIRFVGYSEMTADDRIEEKESKDRGNRKEIKKAIQDALRDGPKSAGQVCNELQDMASIRSIRRAAQALEDEGKLRRSGTNHKNFTWLLATEAEQAPIFDEVTANDSL
jgi:hypothetical protein